jgi:hypothetical protein
MASDKAAVASGLDNESQATRRRNVPSSTTNGDVANKVEIDNKKTTAKKVRMNYSASLWDPRPCGVLSHGAMLTCVFDVARAITASIPRRMGIYHCACHFYSFCFLHADVQDWPFSNCDMG